MPFVIDDITVEDLIRGEEQDGFHPEDERERERERGWARERRERRERGSEHKFKSNREPLRTFRPTRDSPSSVSLLA